MTAEQFIETLKTLVQEKELEKLSKFFHDDDGETKALGVKFGDVFKLAKKHQDMPLVEIDKLLDSPYYEVRMGAASIMAYQARLKKTPEATKKALFDLYLNRHDRLNNWDFVDRAAYDVIGGYLIDKPRGVLYELAASKNIWERRTAIVSTYAFIKEDDVEDTFRIAQILIDDEEELINKAVGSWIREAGKKDVSRLKTFLDKNAATMPRVTLRYATEKLDADERKRYRNMAKQNEG